MSRLVELGIKAFRTESHRRVGPLLGHGFVLAFDSPRQVDCVCYRAKFYEGGPDDGVATIRIELGEATTEVVITNMTVLPENARRRGFGSRAIFNLIRWAQEERFKSVRAVQVASPEAQNFWTKHCGFTRVQEPNPTSDYVYRFS